jgi:hypothetical protein
MVDGRWQRELREHKKSAREGDDAEGVAGSGQNSSYRDISGRTSGQRARGSQKRQVMKKTRREMEGGGEQGKEVATHRAQGRELSQRCFRS